MSLAALALWASLGGAGTPTLGDTLPAGLYPSSIILAGYQAIDGRPMRLERPEFGKRAIWLLAPLTLQESALFSLTVLIRSVGIHLIPWQDLGGAPFIYVSDDPRKVPESSPHFRIAIVTLRHVAAREAADLMNRFAKESVEPAEQGKPAGYFVPEPRTGQLVIRYTSEEQLARYQQMLRLIDVPKKEAQRPVLRTWKARRHFVEELAELFQTEWKKSGGARLSIVPHLETNTLLIRLAPQLWPPVKELLEKLDR